MKIPTFPECDRALIKPLIHLSDYELVDKLQKLPTDGRYFTALFCRYSPVVYSLIRHSARSPVQADYLFALTWRHILNELGGIDMSLFQSTAQPAALTSDQPSSQPSENKGSQGFAKAFSLQAWLISLTAAHINQAVLPEVADIHYALQDAPPPLWCYTERALDSLLPRHRLIILMAQTFTWSDTRIAAYLQAEGEQISPSSLNAELKAAYRALEQALPADIRAIYLDRAPLLAPSANQEINQEMSERSTAASTKVAAEMTGMMTIEFDEVDLQLS